MPRHIGIVGAEASKFTPAGEARAREIITELLAPADSILVSGHCHLGGIDIWAEEIAQELGRDMEIFPPKSLKWEGGYRERNLQIAHTSDIVNCIAVDQLPGGFRGMKHSSCYHCDRTDHVKSGGCWTMHKAKQYWKREGKLWIVENNPRTTVCQYPMRFRNHTDPSGWTTGICGLPMPCGLHKDNPTRDPDDPTVVTETQLATLCRPGKGAETCSFLMYGPDGFECAKHSGFAPLLEAKRAAKSIRALGDNCSGAPDFTPTKDL